MAKLLGYRSTKALQSCLDAKTTIRPCSLSKFYYLVQVYLNIHALYPINFTYILNFVCLYTFRNVCIGDELLHPFVRECYERNTAPSVSDFYEWCQSKNPNHTQTHIYIIFFYNMGSHIYLHSRGVYVSSWSTAQQY